MIVLPVLSHLSDLSHLSVLSQIRSHPCLPVGPIPYAIPPVRPARPHTVEPSLPPTARPAPFVRLTCPIRFIPNPPPGTPTRSNRPVCVPNRGGVCSPPPRPCRACPWALPPLLTPRQPPLGGVWSQGRQAQWRAVTRVCRLCAGAARLPLSGAFVLYGAD
jgi:hypothetical protein